MTTRYEDRINRVTTYIYDHLDEPLDLERLADVASMSPWHWHRVYSAMRDETAAAVRRLRLMRAANELTNSEATVEAHAAGMPPDAIIPFWRVLDEHSPTTGRLPNGPAFVAARRHAER